MIKKKKNTFQLSFCTLDWEISVLLKCLSGVNNSNDNITGTQLQKKKKMLLNCVHWGVLFWNISLEVLHLVLCDLTV